jgi:putative transposase
MTEGLKRFQQTGDFHFVTFSCYQRRPYLGLPEPRNLFEEVLERTRSKYKFGVIGYVVMPEHVHLLLTEPAGSPLAKALMALKISSSKRLKGSPFWQIRYYDFNVFTQRKQVESYVISIETLSAEDSSIGLKTGSGRASVTTSPAHGERSRLNRPGLHSYGIEPQSRQASQKTIKNNRYFYPTLTARNAVKVGHPHCRP